MATVLGPALTCHTPDFILRTLVLGDETEEWGSWLANPRRAAMLNATPRARTLDELRKYIGSFNRRDRHLFGVYEKGGSRLIGIRTIDIDRRQRSFTVHMLVGDDSDWGQGAMVQTTEPLNNWLYETLDLLWSEATVLAINKKMIRYLLSLGWSIAGKSAAAPTMNGQSADLVFMRRHRDIWRTEPRSSFITGITPPTGLEHNLD